MGEPASASAMLHRLRWSAAPLRRRVDGLKRPDVDLLGNRIKGTGARGVLQPKDGPG